MKLQKALLNRLVLFLDYDGSLCPHLEVWEERSYDPEDIQALLQRLAPKARKVFWNTGRRVESLGSVHKGFLDFSGYFIQGSVFYDHQSRSETLGAPHLPAELADFYRTALQGQDHLRLEIKISGMRIAPYHTAGGGMHDLQKFMEANPLPESFKSRWEWHVGARGAELLAVGFDKSRALVEQMKLLPSDSIPLVVGDDLPDRPAVAEAFRRGGYAILVGEHCGWAAELPHKAWQVFFCSSSDEARRILLELTE